MDADVRKVIIESCEGDFSVRVRFAGGDGPVPFQHRIGKRVRFRGPSVQKLDPCQFRHAVREVCVCKYDAVRRFRVLPALCGQFQRFGAGILRKDRDGVDGAVIFDAAEGGVLFADIIGVFAGFGNADRAESKSVPAVLDFFEHVSFRVFEHEGELSAFQRPSVQDLQAPDGQAAAVGDNGNGFLRWLNRSALGQGGRRALREAVGELFLQHFSEGQPGIRGIILCARQRFIQIRIRDRIFLCLHGRKVCRGNVFFGGGKPRTQREQHQDDQQCNPIPAFSHVAPLH